MNRNRTAATALADALALALGQRFPNWRTRFLNLSRHRVAPHATTTMSSLKERSGPAFTTPSGRPMTFASGPVWIVLVQQAGR